MPREIPTGEFFMPILDEKIASWLRRSNMSQGKFAVDVMNMSTVTFSRKRRGINEFTISELAKVCKIVGVSITEAMGDAYPLTYDEVQA